MIIIWLLNGLFHLMLYTRNEYNQSYEIIERKSGMFERFYCEEII